LDLAALLRVLSGNRNDLLGRGWLAPRDRTTIDKMFEVRNRWAHLTSSMPTLDTILANLDVTIDFLLIFDRGKDAPYNKVKHFAQTLRDEGITEIPGDIECNIKQPILDERLVQSVAQPNTIIEIGTIIRLKSTPNVKGMVQSVEEVGGKQKYNVFINNGIKPFLKEQIEPDTNDTTAKSVTITELLQSLTAFQINKPSANSLYSLNSAKIDFVPYQFRPALKLIKSDVPRLLIADSVGVGKTIEAGLILKELQARYPLNNILIICPKPLVAERKWEMEMKDKFGEEFTPVGGAELRNILKDCESDGEWPSIRYGRTIIPYSILSDELMNGFDKRPKISGLNQLNPAPHFDLVIVDEAHHIRNNTTQAYKAVKYFCDHADAAIFLTATPLQTESNDLFTLLNVLFPDKVIDAATFNVMTVPNGYIHEAVRNLRLGEGHENDALKHLRAAANTEWGKKVIAPNPLYGQIVEAISKSGLSRTDRVKLIDATESLNSLSNMINRTRRIDIAENFCVRKAYNLRSQFTERQQELHDTLLEFETRVLAALHGDKNVKFMMSMLRQQAASCIFGLAPSIELLVRRGVTAITDCCDFDEKSILSEDKADIIIDMAQKLIDLSKALPDDDPKLEKLLEIVQKKQKYDNNKIILFTTFKHTQRYLEKHIGERANLRVAMVNGDVNDEERYNLRERFALKRQEESAIDILIFTEVGSEGLDYQFCDTMVNYDLPWNPMRIEQRIGRIDRRGQKSEKVQIYNCITDGTIDADIFDRCLTRIGIFEQNIGDCDEILGELANGIEKIVFDSTLDPKQRAEKLEKLADIKVRNILETQRLEDESKELFGIDISDFTDALDRADNTWLSANAVRRLVEGYLEKRINDGKKHLDGRLLRLSAEAKLLLQADFNALGIKEKLWGSFLTKNHAQTCRIAFEQEEARDDPKALFINPTHALARQAARFFTGAGETRIALSVMSSDVPSGTYPFALYAWEYTGESVQVDIVTVCENERVRNELQNMLQSAIQVDLEASPYENAWNELEVNHLKLWETAKAKYREDTQNLCNFKIESVTQSYNQRMRIAEARAIESIREGEKLNLTADHKLKVAHLRDVAEKADIHFTPLVNGVIAVRGE
jgi:SNF2 family DNA or RNA helicase